MDSMTGTPQESPLDPLFEYITKDLPDSRENRMTGMGSEFEAEHQKWWWING